MVGATSSVGQFFDLGKKYGWWDDSLSLYDQWFEDSILLRVMSDMDRFMCELETDYEDVVSNGFLPTASGKGGADIQAEKYVVTEINTTTLEEKTFKRYKITYNVKPNDLVTVPSKWWHRAANNGNADFVFINFFEGKLPKSRK